MSFAENTLSDFTKALASRNAVPGGGGAAAVCGALGAALGSMVGELTLGKKNCPEPMGDMTAQAHALSERLLTLADADAAAFLPLHDAYALPKDDPTRPATMETGLHKAAEIPLEILRCCCEGIRLMETFADGGTPMAVSDAACGAVLCWGAMCAAAVNVKVNTKSMKDKAFAAAMNEEVDRLTEEYRRRAEKIYGDIYGRFCI